MKKKEFLKRVSAISMAAMMMATAVPMDVFAADIEFYGGEAELQEASTDIFSAEEDTLFSDGAEEAGEDTSDIDTPEAAMQYLRDTYLNDSDSSQNKLITNGGTGVSKSADGLTYTVGLRANGTGVSITSLLFNKISSPYKSGYYIDSEETDGCLDLTTTTAAGRGSVSILKRPAAGEEPKSFKVTLRLFSLDTDDSVINDEVQAAPAALASQEFTVMLEAAEPSYTMSVNVVDEEGNPIPDAEVRLIKGMSVVSPKEDGSYDMEKGGSYRLTVKKDGYEDYSEGSFIFDPTELNTVKTVTLKKTIIRNIKFNVTDKSGNPIDGATVEVKKGAYETISPEADGSYNLVDGTSYNYIVEAADYQSAEGSFTPSQDQTIDIRLEKNITAYHVKLSLADQDGKAVENASVRVTYEERDQWDTSKTETIELKANEDGSYTMKKGVTYTYTVIAPDYKTVTDTYTPSGDDENVSLDVKLESSKKEHIHVFDEGKVTKEPTCQEEGEKTYTCTECGETKTEVIPKLAHTLKWKTVSKATVFQPEKQVGHCIYCNHSETRTYGSKLKATIKLNVSSITLQKKQATKRVRVTMANGDSIKSWSSSNRKIVTVDKNGLIRAQNRTGSAKITVTLKSGKKAVLNVKVQAGKVRTTKISGLKSSMILKKGQKTTLKPVISPLTSLEKVTYTSSNKNVAAVSAKGVITAKKKGTAKITVRSGKKSYVIKVTVK